MADGSFTGADLGRFGALLGNPAGISTSGVTRFHTLTGALTIGGGSVAIDALRAQGDGFQLDLSGRASLADASLTGSGTLAAPQPGADDSTEPPAVPFRLAGTWRKPVVLPDLARLMKKDAGGTAAVSN